MSDTNPLCQRLAPAHGNRLSLLSVPGHALGMMGLLLGAVLCITLMLPGGVNVPLLPWCYGVGRLPWDPSRAALGQGVPWRGSRPW